MFFPLLAVVLLGIEHARILADVEGMNAVVRGILVSVIVNAAAGDDLDVAVFADIKVVVDQILDAALCENDRNVNLLADRAVLHADVDAGEILLGGNGDIGARALGVGTAVHAQTERACEILRHDADLAQHVQLVAADIESVHCLTPSLHIRI